MQADRPNTKEDVRTALEIIPRSEDIRQQLVRVSEQGRLLRSLYRLARRIEASRREVLHAG